MSQKKSSSETRIEHDSLGEVRVPRAAYFGAQTQRAVEHFAISGLRLPPTMIHAFGLVKFAAARANRELGAFSREGPGHLDGRRVEALLMACREVARGVFDAEFPVDVFQTGSGTSSNMNANEVIAHRAMELAGDDRFENRPRDGGIAASIHPNDHVNLGQSTNDVFPTVIHVALAIEIRERLGPSLERLAVALEEKAHEWGDVLKIGRTHLADATPMTLGQEFGGLARQVRLSLRRIDDAANALLELPVGGTAVGTGINTHPEFGARVAQVLAEETRIPFVEALDHFEANAARDGVVECHALLRTVAGTLHSIANHVRWLASGPRCAIYEISLPELQPGSSIMPGKVNPVMCESLMQVAARVVGNDATLCMAGVTGGPLQLNVMMPVMAHASLESVALLASGVDAFVTFAVKGMRANREVCESFVERSLAMVTALAPLLGYEEAAELAKRAFETGKTVREVVTEAGILDEGVRDSALDPRRMLGPSR